jgi:glycosyltransferase involved in cell wall biosynthesis
MLLSIVIPVLNEAETFHLLLDRLETALRGIEWEVIFVNDGSTDATLEMILNTAGVDSRVKLIDFSRNFGHQAAITAGLDFAEGDAVAIMDADLQDPPELLPRMLELMQQGYDVVSPRRVSRQGETVFKKWTAAIFYQMMRRLADKRLTEDVGDFRLFSRRAVLAMRSFREHHRFMRGLVAWLGLREVVVPFERQPRVLGTTKYPLLKMLRFAWTAISSFSALPLRLSIAAGVTLSGGGMVYLCYVLYEAFWSKALVPGWASIVVLQCMFSGMILLALGVIGDYVARTYEETKGRPLYIVSRTMNVAVPENGISRASLLLAPYAFPAPFFDQNVFQTNLFQAKEKQTDSASSYATSEVPAAGLPRYPTTRSMSVSSKA